MTQAAILAASGSPGTTTGFKNRIINGGMVISQRYGTSAQTPTNGQYVLDRFQYNLNQTGKFSAGQYTNAPAGFTNSMGISSNSAYSLGAGDYFTITQPIEGYNVADLGWGTANAKTVTLSAWVYSSLTGTFGGSIMNGAFNYAYPFTYTIPTANTWTQISVTVAGPTAGTWPTDNSASLQVNFSLGTGTTYSGTAGAWTGSLKFSATGAVSVVSTSGATFYLTGVQLEVGTTATNFDFRSYGTELALCQRYYWQKNGQYASGNTMVGAGMFYNSTDPRSCLANPVVMRATPAITFSGSGFGSERAGTFAGTIGGTLSANLSPEASLLYSSGSGTTAGTAGQGTFWYITNNTSYIAVSAEL